MEIIDEPIIKEEESQEKRQVNEAPVEDKQFVSVKVSEVEKDLPVEAPVKDKEVPLAMVSSSIEDKDAKRIEYVDKVINCPHADLKDNLLELMNMGFIEFDQNLMLLQKNSNNLELVITQLFE
jgi:hypothetical protein